jgi:hypothetical protein
MAGQNVDRYIMDAKASQSVLELRAAFNKVESVASFLAYHPRPANEPDPLDAMFNYTPAESYSLRVVFEALNAARVDLDDTINNVGRQLTGLE